MAVKIRLKRTGGKNKPFYRVIAANSASPRDGRFLEVLGFYDPKTSEVVLKKERISEWIAKGAIPTQTVSRLIERKSQ